MCGGPPVSAGRPLSMLGCTCRVLAGSPCAATVAGSDAGRRRDGKPCRRHCRCRTIVADSTDLPHHLDRGPLGAAFPMRIPPGDECHAPIIRTGKQLPAERQSSVMVARATSGSAATSVAGHRPRRRGEATVRNCRAEVVQRGASWSPRAISWVLATVWGAPTTRTMPQTGRVAVRSRS